MSQPELINNHVNSLFQTSSEIIGFVIKMDYERAIILSNDYSAANANHLPQGAFILIKIAVPSSEENKTPIPTKAILCRLVKINYENVDAIQNKVNTIQKLNGQNKPLEEQRDMNDPFTQNHISFFELECKILGTFYENAGKLMYGSDAYFFSLSHIYSVYKPKGESLEKIVNFIKEDKLAATQELLDKLSREAKIKELHNLELEKNKETSKKNTFNFSKMLGEEPKKTELPPSKLEFDIGNVRYASSDINFINNAKVKIFPSDFIKQKTGIFGMTRTGKSNTVKNIIKNVISLSKELKINIGQIIYDINGEYANDNDQNKKMSDVDYYSLDSILPNKQDNKFQSALNNFYFLPNPSIKILQNEVRKANKESNYLNNFYAIKDIEGNIFTHIIWCSLLHKVGFELPSIDCSFGTTGSKYENQSFFFRIPTSLKNDLDNKKLLPNLLHQETVNGEELFYLKISASNLEVLFEMDKIEKFIENIAKVSMHQVDQKSIATFIVSEDLNGSTRKGVSGWQMLTDYTRYHMPSANNLDYRQKIYNSLSTGNGIVIDFSVGDPSMRKYVADELMQYIFHQQIEIFRTGQSCPIINIFIEEAHNLIGGGASIDSLWPRIAKEGAKYNLGLIYATQEPSAIHHNILANTANFIVAHLNNDIEIKCIGNFADFKDFSLSIKNCEDVGFVRAKFLSKTYTIPIQIKKYE